MPQDGGVRIGAQERGRWGFYRRRSTGMGAVRYQRMFAVAPTLALLLAPLNWTRSFARASGPGDGQPPDRASHSLVVTDGREAKTVQGITIVIPERSPPDRTSTARLLQTYFYRGTGVEPRISSSALDGLAIHVGRSPYVAGLGLALDALDDDGFVLKRVDDLNYVIAGPSELGTEFGVCDFLERFLGVRWLLPGDNGTDIPRRSSLDLPRAEVREEPAYYSRSLSGLMNPQQGEWARRLRLHHRVSFHHNLYKLFPPSRYVGKHPEFFPMLGGQRYLPTDDKDYAWQPAFGVAGMVEEAVGNIKDFFRAHPEEVSFSLGINDSLRFDESTPLPSLGVSRKNFLGLPDVSDGYYEWCNAVVEGVTGEFPAKRFGCLAYNNVAEPPTRVKLDPRLLPFITSDRMQWADPDRRASGEELTRRWQNAASVLGWYDYLYGAPYCLPRFYPHLMAEYLRFGYEHGVRAHYAEAYPNWGEGPKLYLHLKLLWNPHLDVDAMLDEWYIRCVGPEAAQDLKEYYAIWERFWTDVVPHTEWFRRGHQYLPFSSPDYLGAADEADIRRSRELLDACVEKNNDNEARKARATLLRNAFEYYETSVIAYGARDAPRKRRVVTEGDALAAIEDDVKRLEAAGRRKKVVSRWKGDPVLDVPEGWDQHPGLRGDDWCAGLLWPLLDWIGKSSEVRARIEGLTRHPTTDVRTPAGTLLRVADGCKEANRISDNPSFEAEDITPWHLWDKFERGSIRRIGDVARTGTHSLVCEGVQRGGPHQSIPIKPGRYLAIGYAMTPAEQASKATVTVTATMRGDDDADLPTPSREVVPLPGTWTPIFCEIEAPERMNGKAVRRLLLIAIVNGSGPTDKVYLDDLALYRLPDAP